MSIAGSGIEAGAMDGDRADLEARPGVDREGEGDLLGVGMGVDGVEGGGLVDRVVVDGGGGHGVIEAARSQRAVQLGQHGLRALQQGKTVARQRLLLLEGFDELLQVIAHGLVPRDDKGDLARPRLRAGAKHSQRRQNQACKPAQAGAPSHGELSQADDHGSARITPQRRAGCVNN